MYECMVEYGPVWRLWPAEGVGACMARRMSAGAMLCAGHMISTTAVSPTTQPFSPWRLHMGYDGFVCVESAKALDPVSLAPDAEWSATMGVLPAAL